MRSMRDRWRVGEHGRIVAHSMDGESMNALQKLSDATNALADAKTLDDVRQIMDIAEAAKVYARAAQLGLEAQNHAAEVKLHAECKAGELLIEMKANGERNGGGRPHENGNTVLPFSTVKLTDLGISKMQSSRWQKVAKVPRETLEQHVAEVKASGQELTTVGFLRIAKEQKKVDRRAIAPMGNTGFELIHSAIDRLALPENSIDAIVTDPPYPQEYLTLFSLLSWLAARVLKPGGSLFVMSGQSYLPEVICRLSEQMRYHWTLAYLTPGGQSPQIWPRKVNSFWKPVLWFVKGEYAGQWLGDVANSKANDNDKRFHGWGQSESGMIDLVQRCTEPGQTILDPFCGGGATGIAALAIGRNFIGADRDANCVEVCRQRLSGASNASLCT